MIKENMTEVEKKWGHEVWIVNNEYYCAKLLHLCRGATSSLHYHPKKRETFYMIEGIAVLVVENKSYLLSPYSRPKTIECQDKHSFRGVTDCIILEVSTSHSDEDVVRLTESRSAE